MGNSSEQTAFRFRFGLARQLNRILSEVLLADRFGGNEKRSVITAQFG